MQLTPYITFDGTCEEALNFYAKALDGEIQNLMRFEGSPAENMSPGDKQKVLHAHFKAGEVFFMASDAGDRGKDAPPMPSDSGMVHLSLNMESDDQLNKVFNALGEGGKVTMPLQDTFWGARFGMLQDKFGINWMFNLEKNK
ncbi:MAG: VOC family protein [Chitinophagaceae bacterium]